MNIHTPFTAKHLLFFRDLPPIELLKAPGVYSNSENWGGESYRKIVHVLTLGAQKAMPPQSLNDIDMLVEGMRNSLRSPDPRPDLPNTKNIFRSVLEFGMQCLSEGDRVPLVRYSMLLKWRQLTDILGENLFSMAWMAWNDIRFNKRSEFFSWPTSLPVDNFLLRQHLRSGIAENHFHLYGSVPTQTFNWLALMNNLFNHEQRLSEIAQDRLVNEQYSDEDHKPLLIAEKSKIAAVCRLLLYHYCIDNSELTSKQQSQDYSKIGNNNSCSDIIDEVELLECILARFPDDRFYIDFFITRIQGIIERLNHRNRCTKNVLFVDDYVLSANIQSLQTEGDVILCSERYLLYKAYHKLFSINHNESDKIAHLLHLYLLLKTQLRQEFIQINHRAGFKNFSKYSKRKDNGLKAGRESSAIASAINGTLESLPIRSFEIRITPSSTMPELRSSIRQTDKVFRDARLALQKRKRDEHTTALTPKELVEVLPDDYPFFYVLHFTKSPDTNPLAELQCRNYVGRNKAHRQTMAFIQLREKDPDTAARIFGIDVASNEIDCRPEVYAQAFRVLLHHHVSADYRPLPVSSVPALRATYHVGEDFLSLDDGLRAIDEAIEFLGLGRGDRLGHVLAMGIHAEDWLKSKGGFVTLNLHDRLDNIGWMLLRLKEIGESEYLSLINRLEREFQELFDSIYKNHVSGVSGGAAWGQYMQAWQLRADDPMSYFPPDEKEVEYKILHSGGSIDIWTHHTFRAKEAHNQISHNRKNKAVLDLIYCYHFDSRIKTKGDEKKVFKIYPDELKAWMRLQIWIQNKIKARGIAVECNPTSNFKIAQLSDYHKHPILRWYNLGLTYNEEELKACPQLSVSINTDDMGVFDTTLENEYMLMAASLEQKKDSNGNLCYSPAMIFDWLNRVRQMGFDQAFRQTKVNSFK